VKKIGILLSGRGSNFEAIARNVAAGKLDAEIVVVLSNRESAPGLALATKLGIPALAIPSRGMDRDVYDQLLVAKLVEHGVELVCLAGYMRLLSAGFVRAFAGRILNIHPSLLPAFPGLDAQHQAIEHGVKVAGCTVHFVDEYLDTGPIVLQATVPVFDEDTAETIGMRILEQEHRIYTEAIAVVLSGNYRVVGRRVLHHQGHHQGSE
jgi:phosphoribosylglycinamide formyltransferase-1